jgi:acyl carrier protein
MNYSEIEQKVRKILADKINLDVDKVHPDSQLVEELGMDSFASVEVMFELEEQFGLKIPDADVAQAKTVKDIVDYVAQKVGD